MAKLQSTDPIDVFRIIYDLKKSVNDNPEARKLIKKLEKKCIQHFSDPKASEAEKRRDVYSIFRLLLQLEQVAENHWEEIKEFLKQLGEP